MRRTHADELMTDKRREGTEGEGEKQQASRRHDVRTNAWENRANMNTLWSQQNADKRWLFFEDEFSCFFALNACMWLACHRLFSAR